MIRRIVLAGLLFITLPAYGQTVSLGTSTSATNPRRSGDATTGLFSSASDAVSVSSGGTEIMRVNGTGVGIGTTSPGNRLSVIGGGASTQPTYGTWVLTGSPLITLFGDGSTSGNIDTIIAGASNTSSIRPALIGRRAEGTLASPLAVASGDSLLSVLASGYDGAAFQNSAEIDFAIDAAVSSGVVPTSIAFYTGSAGGNRTDRLHITSGGLIGVGTTSPSNILSLSGTAAQTFWMERGSAGGNNLTVQAGGGLSGGSNESGGNLILSPGISTGTGTSNIQFQAYPAGTSGTSDNTALTALTLSATGATGSNVNTTLQANGGSGSNKNGGTLTVASGVSTGTGTSEIQFNVYPAGSSGSTANSPTTAMTILGSGNVGIGTSSPSYTLDIRGTVGTTLAANGLPVINKIVPQYFTSSSTYTPTAGTVYAYEQCWGGGGGGGGAAGAVSTVGAAGGGGGGAYADKWITSPTSQTVTIGAGGNGGAAGNNTGSTGSSSSIGSLVVAGGGLGGAGSPTETSFSILAGGAGGSASAGDRQLPGNGGSSSTIGSSSVGVSGAGGFAPGMGGSPTGLVACCGVSTAGTSGGNYGSGGSGAATNSATAKAGGNGGSGYCQITDYVSN